MEKVLAPLFCLHQPPDTAMRQKNIQFAQSQVSLAERWKLNRHKSGILWLTGLSGAGKTTLALKLERALFEKGWQVVVLDGDNLRHGLCADLGFSEEDRSENIRRVGEAATLFANAGNIVISAFISPYQRDRQNVRKIAPDFFHEIHIATPLNICEMRDPKGLYKKARSGEIKQFTGVSAPYESPSKPDLLINTENTEISENLQQLQEYVEAKLSL